MSYSVWPPTSRVYESRVEDIVDIAKANKQLSDNMNATIEMVVEARLDDDQGSMPLRAVSNIRSSSFETNWHRAARIARIEFT